MHEQSVWKQVTGDMTAWMDAAPLAEWLDADERPAQLQTPEGLEAFLNEEAS